MHVVVRIASGYAREDEGRPDVVGLYSDKHAADMVAKLAGWGAVVAEVQPNVFPPGLLERAGLFGIDPNALMQAAGSR